MKCRFGVIAVAGSQVIYQIPYAEMPITRFCSMHCDGCGTYSNYGIRGELSVDEAKEWLTGWAKRILPQRFRLLGGEPSLHKNMLDFIDLAARVFPQSERFLVSNGSHLDRHPDLPKLLVETQTKLFLSFHSGDPKYLERMEKTYALVKTWKQSHDFVLVLGDYQNFIRYYQGIGKGMRPFADNDPVASWKGCWANGCKTIHYGRLWKCPQTALLRSVLSKFDLLDHPDWAPYAAYQGIGLDASDEDLRKFLTRGPEDVCRMCPAKPEEYVKSIAPARDGDNRFRAEAERMPVDMQAFFNQAKG